jgi:hypothetical protein
MAAKNPPRPVNDNRGAGTESAERPHDAGMRVAELDFPAQFLLWGMRCWLAAWRQGGSGQGGSGQGGNGQGSANGSGGNSGGAYRGIAGEGFLRAGVPQALELIDDIFQAVAVAALRQVDLRCIHCAFLSGDESLLLGAVGASQARQHGVAWAALLSLLPPAAARGALPSLISLAVLLRDAGLKLEPLDAEKCAAPELRLALSQAGATAPIH